MKELIITNESSYRVFFFLCGLFLFWVLGLVFQYRKLSDIDRWRWVNNISLILLNSFIVRLLFPLSLVVFADSNNFGLFNYFNLNPLLELCASVIALDLIIYFQHMVFHFVPVLWRLHAVHHSDPGFDATTALRFHPIEIGLSVLVKFLAVLVLGLSPVSVIVFEVLLNFSAMFNHSNFQLPKKIEKIVAKVIVTPDFHRVHHSILVPETNSNFGFCLSIWDHLFSTYKPSSKNDLKTDVLGLEKHRSLQDQRIDSLLLQPFKKGTL